MAATALASGPMQAHALRLEPGVDLVPALLSAAWSAMQRAKAGSCFVMTAVGSLESVTLRMASACRGGSHINDIRTWNDRLEIVSLVGTFSAGGSKHLHMTVSDTEGHAFGGHLVDGRIFTTLELVLGTIGGVAFERECDDRTGYRELKVCAEDTDA